MKYKIEKIERADGRVGYKVYWITLFGFDKTLLTKGGEEYRPHIIQGPTYLKSREEALKAIDLHYERYIADKQKERNNKIVNISYEIIQK